MVEEAATNISKKLDQLADTVGQWMSDHLITILLILVVAYILRRVLTLLIGRSLHRTIRKDLYPTERDRNKRIDTLNELVTAVVRVMVWFVAGLMIISELGINTAPLMASAGVVGIALGFGAQSLIKDFVSGIFIISENQYRIGDVVRIGTETGTIEAITIRTTILRDLDGNVHHVPNGSIVVTTNMTSGFSRINEDIIVAPDADIAEIEKLINAVGKRIAEDEKYRKKIIEAPAFARVDGFVTNGMIVKILGKVVDGEQWEIKGELYRKLRKSFDDAGITLRQTQHVAVTQKPGTKKQKAS